MPELPGTLVDMADSPAIATLQEAAACLATGQPVYGVVTGNGNVRTAPGEDACVLGTGQAGSVVRVDAIQADSGLADEVLLLAALATTDMPVSGADWPLGYAEDVQPIFEAICTNCHGVNLQSGGLRVTTYEGIMAGSQYGPVVVPGDPQASKLWSQIHRNIMPMVGELDPMKKATINAWIAGGALAERPPVQNDTQIWLSIDEDDYVVTANSCTQDGPPQQVISGELVRFATCGVMPTAQQVADLLPKPVVAAPAAAPAASDQATAAPAPVAAPATAANATVPAGQLGLTAGPLGLSAPSEADGWMQAKGGFCVEQRLPQLQDQRGITALAFADDGRLFLGLDSPTTGEPDPLILFDAFHPSRSILVYDAVGDSGSNEILSESSRVTGMDHANGVLYLNRAGEVGRIPDGGSYQTLAGGFAVQGRLFHANNGLVVLNGWLYVSAGGVRDGYSDGIVNPGSDGNRSAESIALDIVTNGNTLAARIVRAPVNQLVQQRSAAVFQTAARGLRNPYGLAADPFGRLWVTDNGATNVAGDYTAGDEVNVFEPARLSGGGCRGRDGDAILRLPHRPGRESAQLVHAAGAAPAQRLGAHGHHLGIWDGFLRSIWPRPRPVSTCDQRRAGRVRAHPLCVAGSGRGDCPGRCHLDRHGQRWTLSHHPRL